MALPTRSWLVIAIALSLALGGAVRGRRVDGPADHLGYRWRRVERHDADLGVRPREYPEHLVRECLPNLFDPCEIQLHALEPLKAVRHALGLRARHQLVPLVLSQSQWHNGLVEGALLWVGELVKDFAQPARRVIGKAHANARTRRVRGLLADVVVRAYLMAKAQMMRLDLEPVHHARGEEDALA